LSRLDGGDLLVSLVILLLLEPLVDFVRELAPDSLDLSLDVLLDLSPVLLHLGSLFFPLGHFLLPFLASLSSVLFPLLDGLLVLLKPLVPLFLVLVSKLLDLLSSLSLECLPLFLASLLHFLNGVHVEVDGAVRVLDFPVDVDL